MADGNGTTIFTTPENSAFYRQRRYHRLEPSKHQFRLLKVYPRRLKIDDIPRVYPQWITRLNWLPRISHPSSVRQPSHDVPLSRLKQTSFNMWCICAKGTEGSVNPRRPPPGFDYVMPGSHGSLPFGWAAVEGASPFYLLRKNTGDPAYEERSWIIVDNGNSFRQGRLRAWYYVNTYTGEATWDRPKSPAPGSPEYFANGLICGELEEYHTLDSAKGQYTALSYCAGSAMSTAIIMVDGILFNAFANLEHSLDCILHSSKALGQDEILIWTDQVCIDQQDNQEKTHQVGMMRHIYEKARHVYVVLSDSNTPQGLIEKSGLYQDEAFRISELLDPERQAHLQQSGSSQEVEVNAVDLIARIVVSSPRVDLSLKFICFFFHLLNANWWSRAWVFQEFITATRLYLLFGSRFLYTWPALQWWLEFVCTQVPKLCESLRSRLQHTDATISEASEQANAANDCSATHKKDDRRLSGFSRQLASMMRLTEGSKRAVKSAATVSAPAKIINGNSQLVDRLLGHFHHSQSQRRSVMHFMRSRRQWEDAPGTMDFRVLLRNAHGFRSTDPRDLVYAFVGLTSTSVTIDADYSASTSLYDVLTKATLACIASDNSLAVLAISVLRSRLRHGLRLPSWVPDWTWNKPFSPEFEQMQRHLSSDCVPFSDRIATEPVATISHEGNEKPRLCVRGVFLGRLTKILKDGYSWSRYFATDGLPGLRVQTTAEALLGDEIWILDGGSAFFILHPCGGSNRSLVHAAGVYEGAGKDLYEQSRSIYLTIIEDVKVGRRKPRTIYLT